MRVKEQFYCTECKKYFLTYLRKNFFGNYTFVCPACQHHHFRVIKFGKVTEERHNQQLGQAEMIMGLLSTISDKSYENEEWFQRRHLQAMRMGEEAVCR